MSAAAMAGVSFVQSPTNMTHAQTLGIARPLGDLHRREQIPRASCGYPVASLHHDDGRIARDDVT